MKKIGLFATGVLFGTAGVKLLCSEDAKKVYAHTTAAATEVAAVVEDTSAETPAEESKVE